MNKVITQLIEGKPVLDNEGAVVYLVGMAVSSDRLAAPEKDAITYTMKEVKEFEVYTSPEQLEIDKLQETIKVLQAQLEVKVVATKQAAARKEYKRLEAKEVLEIEEMFKSGKQIDRNLLVTTYSTSLPVISRILTGKHPKSSQDYKAMIMKQQLGGDDDVNS